MPADSLRQLSRRERQIMDVIYARGEASAAEVAEALPDPPGYSAVRTLLRILEEKGHLKHRCQGPRYIFLPTQPRAQASRSALKRVVQTFFDGSLANAVAALVDGSGGKVSADELKRIEAIIAAAKMNRRT
ncbi:MAG TPA: BlaI/MecI/CopY family transcriptional regulator [Chthoniobacteraceae bacterium]|jgi:predicted transcriptional regulator|nr:BlaI/MecI/CopY family transcriptional regulator [Chthoniobacteraceae bacterium]